MTKTITRVAVAIIIFTVLCALAAWFAPAKTDDAQAAMWYSVIPPLLAIVLAFLTRRALLSLGIAVLTGGLLLQVPKAPLNATAWLEGFKTAGDCATSAIGDKIHLQILAFIPPIFVMIEIMVASGGFRGIIVWLLKWVKGCKSAQAATALMGLLCFIDDYTNAILVGSMMRPITDRFRVSREKLAFLVDATSAPIAGLAVISTWIAYEVGQLEEIGGTLGIGKSGYSMFFDALSYRFYCLLMIVFVFIHILMNLDFGPMKAAQQRAEADEPPEDAAVARASWPCSHGLEARATTKHRKSGIEKGRAINALVPLAGLVLFHLTGLWFDGTGKLQDELQQWETKSQTVAAEQMAPRPVDIETLSPVSWVYWREVIGHAENTPLVLACASSFGLILALIFSQLFGSLRMPVVIRCFKVGVRRALIPFAILILAWSLQNSCKGLKTGEFLTTILAGRVPPYLFPPILFLVASVTSFATGTSYGTMAILIPTGVEIAFALDGQAQGLPEGAGAYGLTTIMSVGAVLDGSIFGDHCSPISDTTIMSSVASSCNLIDHVRTQLPYSLFVAGLALLCAYLPSALGLAPKWSLLLAVTIMIGFFIALAKLRKT